jgi:two-component system chemotaxis response regulator CheB
MPVVMISTLTEKGAAVTLEALELGAVDFVAKPKVDVSNSLNAYAEDIIAKVRMAARAKVRPLQEKKKVAQVPSFANTAVQSNPANNHFKTTDKIIALGSSTGGTEALKEVVAGLPRNTPAIVVSQHLPVSFSVSFAKHVNEATEMTACIAQNGQQILPGNIYISPGDQHLLVVRDGARYICQLNDGPPVNRHKPSVEVMFRSVAKNVGKNAIGVMLTGMGADGSKTMLEMKEAGSVNIVQDEASSVVWGMPGEAFKLGAADHVVPLNKIASKILALAK